MAKRTQQKLTALKVQARRQGWAKWIRSEADERALLAGCRFDVARAEHVVDFFSGFLCHSKGEFAGKPFELLEWQREDLVMPLFGWVRDNDRRRFTRSYTEIPKKNGKSTLAAGVGLYMLCADGEPGAEVYSAANDRKQAGIVHGEAVRMVEASGELSQALVLNRSTWNIAEPVSGSYYRALASTPRSNEGWNGHCCIVDELHTWYGRELWDALRYMFRARTQPLLFVITTAGDDMQSVCREQHDYAAGVLNGTVHDDRFFAYIRAADPEDDWTDPAVWRAANPSLGATINEAEFAEDAREAAQSPASINSFKRYSLNIWTTGESPWLDLDKWVACRRKFSAEELAGRECWAGLDLSKTRDTTALVLAFPFDDEVVRVLPFFWLPRESAEEQNNLVSYLAWAEAGHIELTEGNVCDYEFVKRRIRELMRTYRIRELAFDPYNAEPLTQELAETDGLPRVEFPQNMPRYAGPTAEFERLVLAGKLEHNGHPVLTWQIGNAQVKTDANGNKRPVKPAPDDYRKIDGVVAGVMALGRVIEGEDGSTAYDDGGGDVLL